MSSPPGFPAKAILIQSAPHRARQERRSKGLLFLEKKKQKDFYPFVSAERARAFSPYVIRSFLVLFSKKNAFAANGTVPSFSGEKEAKRLLSICVRRTRTRIFPLCNQKFFGSFFSKKNAFAHAPT
ncbi:hypothetical protein [Novacetimonas maltaceti]|uniref:hypothetical protein n=1 Tax=Novacetimonas maltaceti TaxID=1203393 RepID=UPI00142E0B1A|nr:hypothetical protein [Novacetimonas maltaceti]